MEKLEYRIKQLHEQTDKLIAQITEGGEKLRIISLAEAIAYNQEKIYQLEKALKIAQGN